MRYKAILLKLADVLEQLDPKDFNMTQLNKDALYYLAKMPEAKKLGFRYRANDNKHVSEPEMTWYGGVSDLYAAHEFFQISPDETKYLFGDQEWTLEGYVEESPFECDRPTGDISQLPRHLVQSVSPKTRREFEPPAWTAGRIRSFAKGYTKKAA